MTSSLQDREHAPVLHMTASSARGFGMMDWFALALLVAAVGVAFAPVLQCDFVNYDDPAFVTNNGELRFGLSRHGLSWALWTAYFQMLSSADGPAVAHWHPLVWLTFLVDYELYGLAPWGYHLTNLLWHLGSTLLLFAALRRLTGATWTNWLVAALFAVHPLNVQPVAWVAERKGVVSTFFWMLTLWSYARYAERPSWWRYALVALSLVLGLQAKQMLVTLPCVLLLLDFWPLRRWAAARSGVWLVAEKLPLLALCLAFTLPVLLQSSGQAPIDPTMLPWRLRLGNALVSYVVYLRQALVLTDLAIFYPYHPLPHWQILGAALTLVTLTVVALIQAKRRPYVAVGWLWYVGTLFPVSGVALQLGGSARADRYVYVPMVGIYLAVAWGLAELAQRYRAGRQAATLAATALIGLMIISWEQVHYWQNSVVLWEHCLETSGNSLVARLELAAALIPDDNEAAIRHLQEALRINPNDAYAHTYLGMAWMHLGDGAKAAEHFEQALRLDPDNRRTRSLHVVHLNLGLILKERGDLPGAAAHLRAALRLAPQFAEAHLHLGLLLLRQGELDEAASRLHEALRLDANAAAARAGLEEVRARRSERR